MGQLRSLTTLYLRNCQKLTSLPVEVGKLSSLVTLDLSGCSGLASLPAEVGQLGSLTTLYLRNCQKLASLPVEVGQLTQLEKLAVRGCTALQSPPLAIAAQGVSAIHRYFEQGPYIVSRSCKLVLLGDGEAGKTSLLSGLRAGRPDPAAAGRDGRTIDLELSSLTLHDNSGAAVVDFSCWDVGGQARYAATQQPYITDGALHLLVVRADAVASARSDAKRAHLLVGRWLHYLQVRAPLAVVQLVLTQVDRLLPAHATPAELTPQILEAAARSQLEWLRGQLNAHVASSGTAAGTLRFQPTIPCVCSSTGGDASLLSVCEVLRSLANSSSTTTPPLLPSIGYQIPLSWIPVLALLRALPQGRAPYEVALWELREADAGREDAEEHRTKRARLLTPKPPNEQSKVVPCRYATFNELQRRWVQLCDQIGIPAADPTILRDAVQLLSHQGVLLLASETVYDPRYANDLQRPLVDHRLVDEGSKTPGLLQYVMSISASMPITSAEYNQKQAEYNRLNQAVVDFTGTKAEVSTCLLEFLWRDVDPTCSHTAEHAKMLCDAGVLFPLPMREDGQSVYVLPMRLSPEVPSDLTQAWPEAVPLGEASLHASCSWCAYEPPGLTERAIAALLRLDKDGLQCVYQLYWQRGALLQVVSLPSEAVSSSAAPLSSTTTCLLLLQLIQEDDRQRLSVRVRGRQLEHLHSLLMQLRALLQPILADFPYDVGFKPHKASARGFLWLTCVS